MDGEGSAVQEPDAFESSQWFVERVLQFEQTGQHPDPIASALCGTLFSEREIDDPGFRDLAVRMARIRSDLPKIIRPLPEKMAKVATAPQVTAAGPGVHGVQPSHGRLLPLLPMPIRPTILVDDASLAQSIVKGAATAGHNHDAGASGAFGLGARLTSASMVVLAEQMAAACDVDEVSPFDMMVELRASLHDRCRWEMNEFYDIDLRSSMLYGAGHWLYQCPSHKYKRVTRQLVTYLKDETEEVQGRFSIRRLLRVNRELADRASTPSEHAKFAAIDSVITGGSDMHSQAAHIYVLLCPPLLADLAKRPDCNPEYVTLKVLGMAWMAWDMSHLTELERVRRLQLVEALWVYNIGGEQLYYPFYDETTKKHKGSKGVLVGILSQHAGVFSMQNVLALLHNSAVNGQRRQQNPLELFLEVTALNNEIETFWSQIAIHGYKPRLMELQAIMYKIDGAMRILHDPLRRFYIKLSRKKQYDAMTRSSSSFIPTPFKSGMTVQRSTSTPSSSWHTLAWWRGALLQPREVRCPPSDSTTQSAAMPCEVQ